MISDEMKKKLRALKKLEIIIRFGGVAPFNNTGLVWNELFTTSECPKREVKYPTEYLQTLTKQEIKEVVDLYFSMVYFRYYEENGISFDSFYDTRLLELLDLKYSASEQDIKQKFRKLAKLYHPDTGGDSKKFIELMDTYNSLLKK